VTLPAPGKPAFPQSLDRGSDVVLLIDSSGSMKRTDPFNFRKNAAKLFISLLGTDDRVAVMSFGDAATMLCR
jgi:Mg-chelatase subunit ChlD